jgi:hypothetical protein
MENLLKIEVFSKQVNSILSQKYPGKACSRNCTVKLLDLCALLSAL